MISSPVYGTVVIKLSLRIKHLSPEPYISSKPKHQRKELGRKKAARKRMRVGGKEEELVRKGRRKEGIRE